MKKISFLFVVIFLLTNTFIRCFAQKQIYDDKSIYCKYDEKNGRLNGNFEAYFYYFQKYVVKGKFENNNKVGNWTILDSTGNIILGRNYINNFEYKQYIPKEFNFSSTMEKRDSNGIINYFFLTEKMVRAYFKLCEEVDIDKNNLKPLQNVLISNILNGKIKVYKEDGLSKEMSIEEIKEKFNTENQKFNILRIYEVWYTDSVKKTAEMRILGICPTFSNDKECKELGWIYYPDIRKLSAYLPVENKNKNITNIEDRLHFRDFSSNIYKIDDALKEGSKKNTYNKEIREYMQGDDILKEAKRVKFSLLLKDIESWLFETYYKDKVFY
ncbi:MAG: hypothetical protein NTZ33_05605 [Bacteroidetes bacterium]|nr:hypothetical protein [Bacteroidota bacterium]